MAKQVYSFKEGNKDMREILGGKGANLAEMTKLGLPVPQGFTVSTEACLDYYTNKQTLEKELINQVFQAVENLEKESGKTFGESDNPLLVSVRSGSRASMPGMMDTILNLGMNDQVCNKMAKLTNNERFAYDSYRRFIQMYSDVVMNFKEVSFDEYFNEIKHDKNIKEDKDLTVEDLKDVVRLFKEKYFELTNEKFPEDPKVQLLSSIEAVFKSWNNERAVTYRRLNNIPQEWGTAVNVQEMVYGNMGDTSGSGVAFTRNPSTGENEMYGEYMIDAQGEDVVAGIRTPLPISQLKEDMSDVYDEFVKHSKKLETYYKDMQDMEFTIENGKLFMLQTRSGKRTAKAAIKIAVDLVNEGLITKEEAIMQVNPNQLDALLHPAFDASELKNTKVVAKGLAASPGAATGKVYFTADDILSAYEKGERELILARMETSPEDIEGMNLATGILTIRGGMTSHAAVVARGMGKSAVCGCEELSLNEKNKTLTTKENEVVKEGDYVSIDGSTGNVYIGILSKSEIELSDDYYTFMTWVDEIRDLSVRANADLPRDAKIAKQFGAEGIGLCRTEHMFFEESRIFAFRKMILANNTLEREKALKEILPSQVEDFEGLFMEMAPMPVIIRYLDPPLHEFLPKDEKEVLKLAEDLNLTKEEVKDRIESLTEVNPMMGHRGCRIAVTYPEIAVMQTNAIITAAINTTKAGKEIVPELMIPLIGDKKELTYLTDIIRKEADRLIKESGLKIKYMVGTMIEVPRAAMLADELAEHTEFFSFGTNDLTQMSYGFSRDDSAKFLSDYYKKQIMTFDPFERIDQNGVGKLIEIAIQKGRSTNKNLEVGVCGEHGGEATSIEFCYKVGMDYVSCSPYRVPIARLAAAQAKIKEGWQN